MLQANLYSQKKKKKLLTFIPPSRHHPSPHALPCTPSHPRSKLPPHSTWVKLKNQVLFKLLVYKYIRECKYVNKTVS